MARDAIPKVWSRYDQVLAVNNDWKTIHRGTPPIGLCPVFRGGTPQHRIGGKRGGDFFWLGGGKN